MQEAYSCQCPQPYYTECTDAQGRYQVRAQNIQDAKAACTNVCEESCVMSQTNLAHRLGMNKKTFYNAMGWSSDRIEPWERWGLIGPEIAPRSDNISTWYIIVLIVFIALGGWAATVSWRYNSMRMHGKENISITNPRVPRPRHRVNPFMKCIHAIFAFYFGPIYLLMVQISDRTFVSNILRENRFLPG